jgi:2-phosphosulfolactate phosphatase
MDTAKSAERYWHTHSIVAIDVIRATTTAISAVLNGHECYPVDSIEMALPLAASLDRPLLAGELGGNMPYGFHLNNSPAHLAARSDTDRPVILLSTSGTVLVCEAAKGSDVFIACMRNITATADLLAHRGGRVAVIGAATRGEFREEDEMCCAAIAGALMERGFETEDGNTLETIERWKEAPHDAWTVTKSVKYLRDSGQLDDLEFVLGHWDDVDQAFELSHGQIVPCDMTAVRDQEAKRI